MGRRTLPKQDPSLDLTGRLLTLDDLPRPWRADEWLGRSAPLEVEVGSGKGLFLASAAAAHPENEYLGVEVSAKYARHAAGRLAKRDVTNARVVRADARRLFAEIFTDASLAAVHVYFPDPWWKARHKKRRVMTEAFAGQVERTLAPGGTLHFWTDVEEYFQSTLELLARHSHLEGPLPVAERMAEHDLDYRTHFERRMRLNDLPVHRAEFRKRP